MVKDSRSGNPPPPPSARKSERHPLFGALKGSVHIPDGVDLTEPADPDWGKVYEEDDATMPNEGSRREK
jgi:hypothetical protein